MKRRRTLASDMEALRQAVQDWKAESLKSLRTLDRSDVGALILGALCLGVVAALLLGAWFDVTPH